MKKFITFAFILFSLMTRLNAEELVGEGRFYSQSGDPQEFVKDQLLYMAFRDIITKELDAMELNSSLFWEKYEERFTRAFAAVDDELRKKYSMDNEDPKKRNEGKYSAMVRDRKLRRKRKFGRLDTAINQYSIEQMSRSPQVPNARFIKVKAMVNKTRLHEIYLKFTTLNVGRTFQNIYLTFSFNLNGASWSDLGVEKEADFTSVVYDYWRKWFEDNSKTFIENIYLTNADKEKEILGHLRRVTEDVSSIVRLPNQSADYSNQSHDPMEESAEATTSTPRMVATEEVVSEFDKSLWLKLNINVIKKWENDISKQREFEFSGDYLLIELATNTFLDHQDFERVNKVYSFEDQQKLSSLAASFIYSLPLASFSGLQKKMASIRESKSKLNINIENVESLFDVMQVKDMLADKGIRLLLNPVFKSYDGKLGVLTLNFQGNKQELGSFLSGLNGAKFGEQRVIRSELSPLKIILEKASDTDKTNEKIPEAGTEQTQASWTSLTGEA